MNETMFREVLQDFPELKDLKTRDEVKILADKKSLHQSLNRDRQAIMDVYSSISSRIQEGKSNKLTIGHYSDTIIAFFQYKGFIVKREESGLITIIW